MSGATDLQGLTGATSSPRQCRQIIRNSAEKVLDEVQITEMTNAFQIWPRSGIKAFIFNSKAPTSQQHVLSDTSLFTNFAIAAISSLVTFTTEANCYVRFLCR